MRYFIEVAYDGLNYSGFQVQENALTIQSEVEKALATIYRKQVPLTGSSRTDAQVHALQNYFHTDMDEPFDPRRLYNLNALLPPAIVIKSVNLVRDDAHCRFSALARHYQYRICQSKQPFHVNRVYHYPYPLNLELLQEAAGYILTRQDFLPYSKTNSQVKSWQCRISASKWVYDGEQFIYRVTGNRFLRGMVRALVGTMVKVGRGKITMQDFRQTFEGGRGGLIDFSPPGFGLYLAKVEYPGEIFLKQT